MKAYEIFWIGHNTMKNFEIKSLSFGNTKEEAIGKLNYRFNDFPTRRTSIQIIHCVEAPHLNHLYVKKNP